MEDKPYLKEVILKQNSVTTSDEYPYTIASIRNLKGLEFHPDVTFLVGENGSGKSTLLEAIAIALGLNAEGGNKNTQFKTTDDTSNLYENLTLVKGYKKPSDYFFLRAESFYNLATYMSELRYNTNDNKTLHQYSHGEAFMTTITEKLRGNGLYIFDEPEAALSPNRLMATLVAINDLVKHKSQFIIATHSPILLAYPNAKIYQLDEFGIYPIKYEDTEHYMVTKNFLENHELMINALLGN